METKRDINKFGKNREELYDLYKIWCTKTGQKNFKMTTFVNELNRFGIEYIGGSNKKTASWPANIIREESEHKEYSNLFKENKEKDIAIKYDEYGIGEYGISVVYNNTTERKNVNLDRLVSDNEEFRQKVLELKEKGINIKAVWYDDTFQIETFEEEPIIVRNIQYVTDEASEETIKELIEDYTDRECYSWSVEQFISLALSVSVKEIIKELNEKVMKDYISIIEDEQKTKITKEYFIGRDISEECSIFNDKMNDSLDIKSFKDILQSMFDYEVEYIRKKVTINGTRVQHWFIKE